MDEVYLGQMGHPVESYNPKKLLATIREFIEVKSANDTETAHEKLEIFSLLEIMVFIMAYQGYCGIDVADLFESSIDETHRDFSEL